MLSEYFGILMNFFGFIFWDFLWTFSFFHFHGQNSTIQKFNQKKKEKEKRKTETSRCIAETHSCGGGSMKTGRLLSRTSGVRFCDVVLAEANSEEVCVWGPREGRGWIWGYGG